MLKGETKRRFWEKVAVGEPEECWNWRASKNSTGYGTFYISELGVLTAHRVAAYLYGLVDHVEAPKNRRGPGFICHKCDNPACCNPAHMDVGTYSQNIQEAYSRGLNAQPKGGQHANSPLQPGDARRIRELYATGQYRQQDLAAQFGSSQKGVSGIVRGLPYQDEGGPLK